MTAAFQDNNVGVCVLFPVGKKQNDEADQHAAENSQGDHSGRQDNACGDGPEKKCDVQGLLDRGPETDDGKSADHTE